MGSGNPHRKCALFWNRATFFGSRGVFNGKSFLLSLYVDRWIASRRIQSLRTSSFKMATSWKSKMAHKKILVVTYNHKTSIRNSKVSSETIKLFEWIDSNKKSLKLSIESSNYPECYPSYLLCSLQEVV